MLDRNRDFQVGAVRLKSAETEYNVTLKLPLCWDRGCLELVSTDAAFMLMRQSSLLRLIEAHPSRLFTLPEFPDCYDPWPVLTSDGRM